MPQAMSALSLENHLEGAMARLEAAHLRRSLRVLTPGQGAHVQYDGRMVVNFASNDYLGLAMEPFLVAAVCRATRDFGAGAGASRLLSGTQSPHRALEESLAAFKHLPAALAFNSGFTTALGVIPALVGRGDVVILDKLAHACLVDGARLSGATMRIFAHNDPGRLESLLQWARQKHPRAKVLVVTESVFSMDGDLAPLREIVDLKDRHGAWLLLDEAHGTGVIGEDGTGLAHALGLNARVDIHMGTLGKATGVAGGYIAGHRALVDFLINACRSFIFTTAMPAAHAAAACAAIDWLGTADGRRRIAALAANRNAIAGLCPHILKSPPPSAIVPVPIGPESAAVEASTRCLEGGAFIPAVRFPAVPKGRARLRLTLTANHTRTDLETAAALLQSAAPPAAPTGAA
jgi:8-amino-7-oxononanoate synthase